MAKIDKENLGLQANTTAEYGYNETLCVSCQNAAGSKVEHDNLKI